MAKKIYTTEFKKQIVREYEQGIYGYKKLAAMYNLDRDTVRNWCKTPSLHDSNTVPKKDGIAAEKDLEYYMASAAYWENYAHQLEAQLEEKLEKLGVM